MQIVKPRFNLESMPKRLAEDQEIAAAALQRATTGYARRLEKLAREHGRRLRAHWSEAQSVQQLFAAATRDGGLLTPANDYGVDAWQRAMLTLDTLRERGDNDLVHEAAGAPPVLVYESDVILDGRDLARPVNYVLLRIKPPPGVEVFDWKRPYLIIDPRAGHGAGIGGFKADSQVGVALRDGHPVYFLVFRPHPEPGQTLADVMRAEAAFVGEIRRRHADTSKPIIVGNCQGGWATMILAAANPEISGPLIINGAPLSYWSGRVGENPMRYFAGLFGGALPVVMLADLGNGEFDGVHLVSNFGMLNPGRNYFSKYYDLFANVDRDRKTFLEFERWWGGMHFMNEAEIRWIVEQLFIGNRLARGEARIERGRQLDLKAIRSPIIVFTSLADNITPPQQALNWIIDTYADEHEIKIRGQRIIYMVHATTGHLGIFVSSSIARKEHAEVASTMKTIEALAPGLYEMKIDEQIGDGVDARFLVNFQERKLADLLALDDNDRSDEVGFAAVARLSELAVEIYDLSLRPLVQTMVTSDSARMMSAMHPERWSRLMFSSQNLAMRPVQEAAKHILSDRKAADPANPFLAFEKWWAAGALQAIDLSRDLRDASFEAMFLMLYGSPFMTWVATTHAFERTRKDPKELRFLPEVQAILLGVDRGGFEEAVIRMLILLAESRGSVRRDRLQRAATVLSKDEPFASLGAERRAALIREQSIIVEFESDRAINTLPVLLSEGNERKDAIAVVEFIAGSVDDMDPQTVKMLQRFRSVLGLPAIMLSVANSDPLAASASA
ncbi:3-hydroxyalkanoate synthetase [Methylocystis bryophila]|nr:3-hydroxyalkanoate synthetase [Methylocystis bryophila]